MAEEDTDSGKTSILKGWATVIASLAALVTAISALLKPPQEPAAKAAYETLAAVVKENSEQNAKNHDDIENLRNFMEGYTRGNGSTPAVVDAGTSAPSAVASGRPTGTIGMGAIGTLGHGAGSGTGQGFGAGRPPPAPPPTVGPRPKVWSPPDFSQMKK
jgi:hypothetical protein